MASEYQVGVLSLRALLETYKMCRLTAAPLRMRKRGARR